MYKLYEKAERNIFFLADSKVLLVIQYIDRSSHRSFSIKKLFLKFLQCSQENTPVLGYLLNEVPDFKTCNFNK